MVLTHDQLDRALDAGARFIVVPASTPDMVRYGLSKGALMVPGTATPGEMEQAMALGLEVVKFFPAEQNGGVAKLKAGGLPHKNPEMDAYRRRQCQESGRLSGLLTESWPAAAPG